MDGLEQLLEFIAELREARIEFDLKSVRDAVMVTVRSPRIYYEVEFFADGHVEVQSFGPPSDVQTVTLRGITDRVIRDVNG